jgi:beta-ribofuranosylaminobenzene 5'-phosphate synthase
MTESPADDAKPWSMTVDHSLRITTGSRLHFGLLDTVDPFGGVGVMIDQPVTEVAISPSDRFLCDDIAEPRIRAIAERVAGFAKLSELPKCRITVTRRAAEHCGLGSGTQLALAAAEGLCRFQGIDFDAPLLACQFAIRGQRSAIGVHGYFSGGLVFEGAETGCELNRLQHRVELPSQWRVAIFRPKHEVASVSGDFERQQFADLSPASEQTAAALKRIVTEQIIPAAEQQDFGAFASSVHRYNHESGKLFERVQGGPYHGTAVAGVVQSLMNLGAQGVGQSSWGPGVFAWFSSNTEAEEFVGRLPADISLIALTRPRNQARHCRSDLV